MVSPDLPSILLKHLQKIDPSGEFTGNLPRVDSSTGNKYFVKLGSAYEKEQLVGEAESLHAMGQAAPGLAPRMFAWGTDEESGKPYFISEYKSLGHGLSEKAAQALGKRMATELHRYESKEGFGFAVPTFCGPTRQENGWYATWEECFGKMIGDLLNGLRSEGRYGSLVSKGKEVRQKVIPYLLKPLDIKPVLLHGDLWSGNAGIDRDTGEPVIFDPSSFYGHNEADLAIARIFGGFPRSFFKTYHDHLPKSEPVEQYELRSDLYELYHYLNHTLLFGGAYSGSAMRKIDRLLRECP